MRLFEDSSNALFKAGAMTHNYGLVFAICPVASVPTHAHKLMTMDVETGVAINTSLSITTNLGVAGGVMSIGNRILSANGVNGGLTTESTVYANAFVSKTPLMYYGTNTVGKSTFAAGATIPTTSVFNIGGYFNNTNYTFTVPYACYVKVSAAATIETTSSGAVSVAV